MDWYLNFEWQISSPVDEDQFDDLMTGLADFSPSIATSNRRIRTSIALDAPDAEAAIATGLDYVRSALRAIGIDSALTHVDADTDEEMAARLREVSLPRLVGITEIANYLGVTRQRASELGKSEGFPRAVTRLASGPVWLEASMLRFASNWKRTPGRRSA
jgi:hypothetical protein